MEDNTNPIKATNANQGTTPSSFPEAPLKKGIENTTNNEPEIKAQDANLSEIKIQNPTLPPEIKIEPIKDAGWELDKNHQNTESNKQKNNIASDYSNMEKQPNTNEIKIEPIEQNNNEFSETNQLNDDFIINEPLIKQPIEELKLEPEISPEINSAETVESIKKPPMPTIHLAEEEEKKVAAEKINEPETENIDENKTDYNSINPSSMENLNTENNPEIENQIINSTNESENKINTNPQETYNLNNEEIISMPPASEEIDKNKKSKLISIMAIVVLILIIAGSAFVAYKYIMGNADNTVAIEQPDTNNNNLNIDPEPEIPEITDQMPDFSSVPEDPNHAVNDKKRQNDLKNLSGILETYYEENLNYPAASEINEILKNSDKITTIPGDPLSSEENYDYVYAIYNTDLGENTDYVLSAVLGNPTLENRLFTVSSSAAEHSDLRNSNLNNVVIIKTSDDNPSETPDKKPKIKRQ